MQANLSRSGLSRGALLAGLLTFLLVYGLGALLVVFAMALVSGFLDSSYVIAALRLGGYLSLALPAYVSARVAGTRGVRHGLVIGVLTGACVLLLMTFTFSWEGTVQEELLQRMLPVFLGVVALSVLGGGLGEWQNRHHAEDHR